MNASTNAASHANNGSKFHLFIQVAMLLAVITGVEIILIYIPFPKWLLVAALAGLSVVKFGYVIFAFMHLRWDRLFCTLLFLIGLSLAGGILWALLRLFAADASRPLETASGLPGGAVPVCGCNSNWRERSADCQVCLHFASAAQAWQPALRSANRVFPPV